MKGGGSQPSVWGTKQVSLDTNSWACYTLPEQIRYLPCLFLNPQATSNRKYLNMKNRRNRRNQGKRLWSKRCAQGATRPTGQSWTWASASVVGAVKLSGLGIHSLPRVLGTRVCFKLVSESGISNITVLNFGGFWPQAHRTGLHAACLADVWQQWYRTGNDSTGVIGT